MTILSYFETDDIVINPKRRFHMPLQTVPQPVICEVNAFYEPPIHGGQGHDSLAPILAAQDRPFYMPQQSDGEHEFSWRADYETTANFGVARVRGDRPCILQPHPVHQALIITFPLEGKFEAIVRGDSITARPGQALLLSASHAGRTTAHPDPIHAHVAMFFPKVAVSRFYSRYQNPHKENTKINSVIELDTPIGNSLYCLTKTILSDLFGKQYFKKSAESSRLVAELALHIVFDGHIKQLRESADEKAAPYVHRAVKFIDSNLHRPMTISTIAEAVGVSSRSLQSGFQLAYGMTPMIYLRKARLEMVHAELSDPDNFLSVGEVASKWGFTHLSRFSTLYRDEFGVSPSATSRKRR